MKIRMSFLAVFAIAVFLLNGCGNALDQEEKQMDQESVSEMTEVPSFEMEDFQGNKITEKCFTNADLTIFNVWSTTCGPCVEELGTLERIKEEYKDQSVQVIGVLADGKGGEPDAIDIVSQQKITFSNLVPDQDFLENFVTREQAVPYTVFVDSKGKILKFVMGSMKLSQFQDLIQEQMR